MLRRVFTHNLALKIVAVIISFVTWSAVVYAGNPPTSRTLQIHVPQDIASIPAQYVRVQPIPDISVTVSGTRDHVDAFAATSLRLLINYKSITHAGVQQLPLTVTNTDPNVDIEAPSSVQVDVDTLGSVTVPVQLVINPPPPQGYITTSTSVIPGSVTVAGPSHELIGLRAEVTLDLSTDKTNIEADVPVRFYNGNHHVVTDVSTTQTTARVSVTVSTTLTSRSSAVVPKTTGAVADGYALEGVAVTPPTVTLSGPRDILNALDSVSTESLALDGRTGNITVTLKIAPPAGVSANPTTVVVTLTIVRIAPAPTPTPTPSPSPTPTP